MTRLYVIILTLPSGGKMAWSRWKDTFALVELKKDGTCRGALGFATEQDALDHIDAQLKVAPNLENLGPFEVIPMLDVSLS